MQLHLVIRIFQFGPDNSASSSTLSAFQMQVIVTFRGPLPPCNRNDPRENDERINSVSIPKRRLLTLPGDFSLVAKVCHHLQFFAHRRLPSPLYKVAQYQIR